MPDGEAEDGVEARVSAMTVDERRFVLDESTRNVKFYLMLAGVGVAAGLVSSFLGVGGGIVMVPILAGLLKFPQHAAHATSLAAIVLIAASGFAGFALSGEVAYSYALLILGGGVVGAYAGARAMHLLSPRRLSLVFAVVLIGVGIRMLT